MANDLFLLVGGTHDGERVETNWLLIEVIERIAKGARIPAGPNDPLPQPADLPREHYTRRHLGGGIFSAAILYAIESMDDADVARALIEKYPTSGGPDRRKEG